MSIETIKARLTPEQLKDLEDPRMSIINFCSNEDLEREYQEIAQKVREMPEEDLTIYHEEDLTEQEKEDLPEGTLMREKGNGPLYMKVLDIWEPYRVLTLHTPERDLGRYGRMRLKYLEEWKVRKALELGEEILVHCLEVQDRAKEMKREIMDQWREQNPSDGTMEWVQRAEMADSEAERFVLDTVIWPEASKAS